MSGALVVSALCIGVVCLMALSSLATILSSVFVSVGNAQETVKSIDSSVASNATNMKVYQDRYNGRSWFFKPPAWPAPPAAPVERKEVSKPTAPVPPAPSPTHYDGPGILYAIDDLVRFRADTVNTKSMNIRVGEEVSTIGGPLKVLSVDLPWKVRVAYKGKEYDVQIFARGKDDQFFKEKAPSRAIVRGVIEVPPPKTEVPTPDASGSPDGVEANIAAHADGQLAPGRNVPAPANRNTRQPAGAPRGESRRGTKPGDEASAESTESGDAAADKKSESEGSANGDQRPAERSAPVNPASTRDAHSRRNGSARQPSARSSDRTSPPGGRWP